MIPTTRDAYKLMHDGALALAEVEANGIRVDVEYLDKTISKIGEYIKGQEAKLRDDPIYETWRKTYGSKANLGSREQLSRVLFEILKYPSQGKTVGGDRESAGKDALELLEIPFADRYIKVEKFKKLLSKDLLGIKREVTAKGLVHASMNTHLTVTYRSQCDSPNLKNIPIRDEEVAKIIRRAFIPRPGNSLLEVDMSGAEVRVGCCYHQDPRMIRDVLKGDMHRDMAAKIFFLPKSEVPKMARQIVKGDFVFAEFYGGYYIQAAQRIWKQIKRTKLETNDGIPMGIHLERSGIRRGLGDCSPDAPPVEGTFESHLAKIEKEFWEVRYPVYNKWRKDWYAQYLERGYIDMLTGFRVSGVYRRNDIINYPVQGASFHTVLWSLIQLQRWLRKNQMKSKIINEIYDSILLDCPQDELLDVANKAAEIMTVDVRKHFDFITIPLKAEAESSDRSWADKHPLELTI